LFKNDDSRARVTINKRWVFWKPKYNIRVPNQEALGFRADSWWKMHQINEKTGIERVVVMGLVESFMETIKNSMVKGENIYLRGFGIFILKKRAEKLGRNIT
jgi:hypothetical protein